ncbi:YhdP family phospholipid transporter [Nitrincola tapanii]|uniref:YhdP central domain-containing protein n=1 Tax=Nitrincola tapanii TaxID=1708751 RepID=A0A5A9VZX2_9GAMM|nr:AsmA-like C-terminal region-containing protein [Nitrincola tapanii]KAA0874050.1 hypothetical protein E1H14_09730 [Nitrincola tapanii]
MDATQLLKRLISLLKWLLITLALCFVLLRLSLPWMSQQQARWLPSLMESSGLDLEVSSLTLRMDGFLPYLALQDLRVQWGEAGSPHLSLRAQSLELWLDPWRSLLFRTPVLRYAHLSDADLHWQEQKEAWLRSQASLPEPDADPVAKWMRWLLLQPEWVVDNLSVGLKAEEGDLLLIAPIHASFKGEGQSYAVQGSLQIPQLGQDTQLAFALQGQELDLQRPLFGQYEFYLSSDALGTDLLRFIDLPLPIQSLHLGTEIWGAWQAGQLTRLQGQINLDRLDIDYPGWPNLQNFSTRFDLQPLVEPSLAQENLYQLHLFNTQWSWQETLTPLPDLVVNAKWQEGHWPSLQQLFVTEVNLEAVSGWLLTQPDLPTPAQSLIQDLGLQGALENLVLDWTQERALTDPLIYAELAGVAIAPWQDAPGGEGIEGYLEASLSAGQVWLDSQQFQLYFPELFDAPWQYQQAQGLVAWQLSPESLLIQSHNLHLKNAALQAQGRFSLYRPFDLKEQAEFTLMIGLHQSDALQTPYYLPDVLNPSLRSWLSEAVHAGRIEEAGLLLHMGLRSEVEARLPLSLQMFFALDQVDFDYQPGWPRVQEAKAKMLLQGERLDLNIESGRLLNTQVTEGQVILPEAGAPLEVSLQLQGPLQDLDQLLKSPVLDTFLPDELKNWQMQGQAQTALSLSLPLEADAVPGVQVKTQIEQGRMQAEAYRIQIDQIQGALEYDSAKGLEAEKLTGRFYGEEVQARIGSNDPSSVELVLNSRLSLENLGNWLEQPLPEFLSGQLNYQANLEFCADQQRCPLILIRSDLRGIGIDLPFELGKTPEQAASTRIDYYPLHQRAYINYRDQARAVVGLETTLRGHVRLNAGPLTLPVSQVGEAWRWQLESDEFSGVIRRRVDSPVILAEMAHITLQTAERSALVVESEVEVLAPTQRPGDFPALNLQIDALSWNQKDLGRWQLEMRPQGNHLLLPKIQADLQDLRLEGQGRWIGSRTELNLTSQGQDLGNLLQRWQWGHPIETQSVMARAQMEWPGAPWQFRLANLSGFFSFEALDGRLIETSQGANLLRVFGILNLSTLTRRLRFDFSDLLKKGVVFDRLAASYDITQGIAQTQEPLSLKGPSADIQMQGQIDLVQGQLNKQIEVAIPLGSNLTLGAALLGAPYVAGAIFIVDRVLGDRIEKMTSIRYRLSGDWSDPQVQLLNTP